jgi:hypothetical protein
MLVITNNLARELAPGSRASERDLVSKTCSRASGIARNTARLRVLMSPNLDSSETDVPGVLLTQIDIRDLRHRDQHLAAAFVGERENAVAADCY